MSKLCIRLKLVFLHPIQQQRCKSEPKTSRGRSVTPPTLSSSSPLTFAGPKCLEPPTPTSLPRPPTTWTRSDLHRYVNLNQIIFNLKVWKKADIEMKF